MTDRMLEPATLRALEQRIFDAGEITVEDAAATSGRDVLVATIRKSRAAMRTLITTLPDCAFEQQPPGPDGEPVWSAGEIAGHIAESMLWLQYALARLAGDDPQIPGERNWIAVRSRAASLEILDVADRALDDALKAAHATSSEPRIRIDGLGNLGVRGLLLLHAMHEAGHASQLRELGVDWDLEGTGC